MHFEELWDNDFWENADFEGVVRSDVAYLKRSDLF